MVKAAFDGSGDLRVPAVVVEDVLVKGDAVNAQAVHALRAGIGGPGISDNIPSQRDVRQWAVLRFDVEIVAIEADGAVFDENVSAG